MTGRALGPGVQSFDAVETGDHYATGDIEVTADLIDRFADLSGDRFEIHMDDEAARRYGFPGRVAHGLLVLSLVDGLKNQAEARFRAIASLGWTWSFRAPVFIGDRIGAAITIADKRTTGKPDRGILTLEFDVTANGDRTVQSGTNLLMVYR